LLVDVFPVPASVCILRSLFFDRPTLKICRKKEEIRYAPHRSTEKWQKVMMLPPGQYEYKFLVDGQWRTDPNNPRQCTNCYGTNNNILHVQDSRL